MDSCLGCKLYLRNNGLELTCDGMLKEYPTEAVAIVEKWSEEHPQKTILDDLLEKYPNAKVENGIQANACAMYLGYCEKCEPITCRECWNRPLSEVK